MPWVIKLQENALYFDCFGFIKGRLLKLQKKKKKGISKPKGNQYEQ